MSETRATEASDEPLIGATINGRYRVISLIARGGMGKVFKAEQSALGRTCALKVLSPKYQGERDPEFHRRFSLEAATASKLNHPNTVTIFDHGKCDEHGVYFIAMEYLNGRTLHQMLHAERPVPEPRANRIAQQICRSVAEAHALGVVHRDLKPGNVMLLERDDEQDVVKVLDFGLVKDVSGQQEELTQTGLFMGSPKYMSPEQITAGDISPRTDIYALGVILYEMLCGAVPFDKKASMNTLMAHVNEPPPPMGQMNPAVIISKPMESIVMRCLEKDPGKRFATMRELLNALKRSAGDITGTFESLPQITLDAAMLAQREAALSRRGSDPKGPTSTPPPSWSGAARANSAMTSANAIDSLAPPPAPPTFTGALSSPRNPAFRTYAVAIAAALVGGGLTLSLANRGAPSAGTPTSTVTSVFVPTPIVAPTNEAASASNQIRSVRVESEPSGATVSDRGTELCMSTPCEIIWRGAMAKVEHRLNLSKRGFKSAMLVVSPTAETVSAKLDNAPSGWQPPPVEVDVKPAPSVEATASPVSVPSIVAAAPTAVAAVVAPPTAEPSAQPTAAPAAPAAPAVMRFEEGMNRPVRISGRDPTYTREALETRVQGTVIAKCIITTAGTLSGCRIIKSLPHMDEAVLAALASHRYQPILYQGRPVNVDYVFTMKMVPP
jgi:eukaryotic-like serine/threonine-protein kinase